MSKNKVSKSMTVQEIAEFLGVREDVVFNLLRPKLVRELSSTIPRTIRTRGATKRKESYMEKLGARFVWQVATRSRQELLGNCEIGKRGCREVEDFLAGKALSLDMSIDHPAVAEAVRATVHIKEK